MASGKNPRMDRRSSSSYCSTVTLVVFVALCLVGVWMITSSAVVPIDVSTSDNKSDVKESLTQTEKSFEDSLGDVQEEVTKSDIRTSVKDAQEEANADASQEQNGSQEQSLAEKQNGSQEQSLAEKQNGSQEQSLTEKQNESQPEVTQEANTSKENDEAKNASDEASQTYSDTNGNEEGADANKDGGQGDEQSKPMEQNSEETRETELNSNESANSVQEQSDNEAKSDGGEKADGVQEENGQPGIQDKVEEKAEEKQGSEMETSSEENKTDDKPKDQSLNEVFPDGAQSDILNETNTQNGAFSTQATESNNEKEAQKSLSSGQTVGHSWKLCNVTAGADYIPCLDNENAIRKLRSTKHYEHRERHCPEEGPTCLVPLPEGYRQPIKWPQSRDKIWYFNVPHTKLAEVKGHQNWVKVTGEYLTFPGGGTQFKHGALHYIDFIQESLPDVAWGKRSRVILDVGCGVASFGGFLFDRDVLAMSFAPKDEHEAQVQFALERGIPAISAVMGTKRLPFPSKVFDIVHCARCRVPWHIEGGTLLLELNRLLRPGGYFVWSATPVYQKLPEDVEIWKAMANLAQSMCWELLVVKKDKVNGVGVAIYRKPSSNECYESRKENSPPLCQESDDPDAAWNVPLQACMHRVPEDPAKRGSQWPEQWPKRLEAVPYWLNKSQVGVYGKPAPEDFLVDYQHWKHVVSKSYLNGMGINWSNVRNVMDMRAIYGGFAAALRDVNVWVMNIVSINSPDTLPLIYERGLFGMYHDWCESFSSYPRSYDLLHADHLLSKIKKRCKLLSVMAEVDRLLRPGGKLIVRDNVEIINEVESMARSLQWEIRLTYSKQNEGLLCVQKTMWRP